MTDCDPGCAVPGHLHACLLPDDIAEGLAYLAEMDEIGEQANPEGYRAWRRRRAVANE